MLLTVILIIIISFPSSPHSFNPGLKPSFFCKMFDKPSKRVDNRSTLLTRNINGCASKHNEFCLLENTSLAVTTTASQLALLILELQA